MKSYNHLYEKVLSEDNRRLAVKDASRGKAKKRLKYYCDDADESTNLAYDWITNYKNSYHKPTLIYDGISRKQRKIITPTFRELTVQHAIGNVLKPIFMSGMYEHTYASIPNRGAHRGKKVIEKWIRNDPKNCKYVLKMDIKHFFRFYPAQYIESKIIRADSRPTNAEFTVQDNRCYKNRFTAWLLYVSMVCKLLYADSRPLYQREIRSKALYKIYGRYGHIWSKQERAAPHERFYSGLSVA